MTKIADAKIAILATHGYERSELRQPLEELRAKGAEVHVVSPEDGEIRSWDAKDWGDSVKVDQPLAGASPAVYDALILPGGQINPDVLRTDEKAVDFVQAFIDTGKTVAVREEMHEKNCPPFALIGGAAGAVEPVMKPASSEARNTTQRAISSGSPRRPTGIWAMIARAPSRAPPSPCRCRCSPARRR
jgi:hypothetical protein